MDLRMSRRSSGILLLGWGGDRNHLSIPSITSSTGEGGEEGRKG